MARILGNYVNRDYVLPTSQVKCILISAEQDAARKLTAQARGCAQRTKPKSYARPAKGLSYYRGQILFRRLGRLGQDDGEDLGIFSTPGTLPVQTGVAPDGGDSISFIPTSMENNPTAVQSFLAENFPNINYSASNPNALTVSPSGATAPITSGLSTILNSLLSPKNTGVATAGIYPAGYQPSGWTQLNTPMAGTGLSPLALIAIFGGGLLLVSFARRR